MEKLEFETSGNNKEYKVESISDNAIYTKELEVGHLLGFYYLVLQKSYAEDENI